MICECPNGLHLTTRKKKTKAQEKYQLESISMCRCGLCFVVLSA